MGRDFFAHRVLTRAPFAQLIRLVRYLDGQPLQTRISFLVGLGLLIILILFTWLGMSSVQQTTDNIIQERLSLAQATASYVDSTLSDTVNQLEQATTFASLDPQKGDLNQESHLLADTYSHIGSFTEGVLMLDQRGMVVIAQPPSVFPANPNMSAEPFVEQARESGQTTISNGFFNPTTQLPTVAVIVPVTNRNGDIVSLLCALINLDSPRFTSLLSASTNFAPSGYGEIVDASGNVVASSDPGAVLRPSAHADFFKRMLKSRSTGVEETSTSDIRQGDTQGNQLMAFVPLKSVPWGLGLGASTDATFAPVHREQTQAAIVGVLSLIVALFVAGLTTRRVVRPIEALTEASERMASGDLASPVVATGGDPEIERLSASFDEMRSKLQTAYNALTVEKSQYQGIFRSMADPVFTVDTKRQLTSLNPAAERILGCTESELFGLSCVEILRSRDGGEPSCCSSCPLLPVIDSNEAISGSVELVSTRRGKAVPVEMTRAPVLDDDGKMVGVVHVLRDISTKEELDRMKEQLLANVSHELRSPLGYIKGYASTLLGRDTKWSEPDRRKFLHEIVYGSEQLQHLVDKLLDGSRLQAGTFTVDMRPTQIREIVNAAVKWVKTQSNGLNFVVNLPRRLSPVMADPQGTEQVLRNLLENAVKYSQMGTVTVTCRVEDGMAILSVTDEGIGIPEDQLDRIFERFHRVHTDSGVRVRGFGLGLSICRAIVEAQGGKIWVESVLGQGSTFHFSIRLLEEGSVQEGAVAASIKGV